MRVVGELGPGKCFGELALITNKPRAATVMCLEDSQFATLDKASFHKSLAAI
jgi:CRP-like cAMP-binding protein